MSDRPAQSVDPAGAVQDAPVRGFLRRRTPVASTDAARSSVARSSGATAAVHGRVAELDAAKGLAIILVVLGHCLRGLMKAEIVPASSWLHGLDYVIYTFHMPAFFLLAGLFFRAPPRRLDRPFWLKKLETIAYPYLLWSVVQGAVLIVLSSTSAVNNQWGLADLLQILWIPISPFWFLYALFFCNVLAMLFAGVGTRAVVAFAFAGFLLSMGAAPATIADIFYGFFYFALGMMAAERTWLARIPCSWTTVAVLWSAVLMVAVPGYWLGLPDRLDLPAAALGIAATISLCTALGRSPVTERLFGLLVVTGRYSMGVFVLHILVMGFTRLVLLRLLHVDDVAVLLSVMTAAAVVIPILVQAAAVRLRINVWLGLPFSAGRAIERRAAVPS